MPARHKWTEEDDIVALYLFRFGDDSLSLPLDDIGAMLGMGAGSLLMRIGNFRAIDGGGGLSNYARQSKEIFEKHKATPKGDLRITVEKIISAAR